ncbi:MAG: ATP-binding protein, partial [Rubrobacteraceae bacterium]
RNRYTIDLSISDEFPRKLSERTGRELVRIVQEAMSNVRRHAAPSHARVHLGIDGETAWVEVSDDGRGFDPELSEGGVGMSAMKRRAQDLGGTLRITSQPGEGSRVRFEIPLERLTEADTD